MNVTMTQATATEFAAPQAGFESALGRTLSDDELLAVSGGDQGYSEVYTTAVGVAVALVTAGAAFTGAPVVAGAFVLGSIGASAIAIFSELDEEKKTES